MSIVKDLYTNPKSETGAIDFVGAATGHENVGSGPTSKSNFLPRYLLALLKQGPVVLAVLEAAVNRDTIENFVIRITHRGFYSPILNAYVINVNGIWYRTDTGQEYPDNLNVVYLNSTDIRAPGLAGLTGQHDTVNASTFQSPDWIKFSSAVAKDTESNPYDVNAITTATYDHMTFDPNFGSLADEGVRQFSDHTFQNILASDLTICFDYAVGEQAYLATLGIPSEVVSAHFITDQGSGNHSFLIISDKNGGKWIADPASAVVESYDDYVKNLNLTNIQVIPSSYSYPFPEEIHNFKIGP